MSDTSVSPASILVGIFIGFFAGFCFTKRNSLTRSQSVKKDEFDVDDGSDDEVHLSHSNYLCSCKSVIVYS